MLYTFYAPVEQVVMQPPNLYIYESSSPKSQTNVIENKLTRQLHDALAYFQLH